MLDPDELKARGEQWIAESRARWERALKLVIAFEPYNHKELTEQEAVCLDIRTLAQENCIRSDDGLTWHYTGRGLSLLEKKSLLGADGTRSPCAP